LNKIINFKNLKQRLDEIDNRLYQEVYDGFYESRLKILIGMWEKGAVIDWEFRGVNSQTNYFLLEKEVGRDHKSLKKWHDLYKQYPNLNDYLPIAQSQAASWTEEALNYNSISSNVLVTKHTRDQENYTPEEIIECVKKVLGSINLDPASCELAQKIVNADKYFTEDDDGLKQPWFGNIFLNPPYQFPEIEQFTNKLIEELPNINSAILLTNNNTDTKWFRKCAHNAQIICFTEGRINFYKQDKEKTYPTNGQTFFYYGNNDQRFIEIFKYIGFLVKVIG